MNAGALLSYMKSQGYPANGARIGRLDDRNTWLVVYDAGTAQNVIDAGNAAMRAVELSVLIAIDKDDYVAGLANNAALKATMEVLLRRTTPDWNTLTAPQKQAARDALKAEWITIYKALA